MKIMKNISRYFFMALLLAGCVLGSLYCGNAAAQLQSQIESPAFIDMTIGSTADAIALLEQQEYFRELMRYGIIAAVVVVLLTCAMIVTPILVKKWKKRPRKEKPAAPKPARKPADPVWREVPQAASPASPVIPEAPPAAPFVVSEEPPAPQEPQPAVQQPPQVAFCPNCGKRQNVKAKFCANCGQRLL